MGPVASHAPSEPHDAIARIGPNAIIQVAAALCARCGAPFAEPLLAGATGYHLHALPSVMVDEREAQALVRAVTAALDPALAHAVLRDAGQRTGDYLLANRIPRFAQWIMRAAPRRVGLALLLKAMQANAWTFAGSGRFLVHWRRGIPELCFESCAMCRAMVSSAPMCDFYGGTFERLIQSLVSPAVTVTEVECMAQGGACCRFVLEGIS